jgi:hypothetical protein
LKSSKVFYNDCATSRLKQNNTLLDVFGPNKRRPKEIYVKLPDAKRKTTNTGRNCAIKSLLQCCKFAQGLTDLC